MQWAAVSTQHDLMRTPPQMCLKDSEEPLDLICREACQGWAPGSDFFPPKILAERLGCGLPHWENWVLSDLGGFVS